MPQWTRDQQTVIGSPARSIICSAAAGSGKTAVMIERIVRMIREGADPFSFLVITFTNAAASEMREKIRHRLASERKNPVMAAAAEKAAVMEISTIHAFCQRLIRQEFQIVRVDPSFQICTGAQRNQLFEDAFRDACNRLRQEQDADYLRLVREYDRSAALEMVKTVYEFIMSLPDPFGWLREKTENVPADGNPDHPWFRVTSRIVRDRLQGVMILLRQQSDMFGEYENQEAYREVWKADREIAESLLKWSEGGLSSGEALKTEFVKVPSLRNLNSLEIDWKERYQALRNRMKKEIQEILALTMADREKTLREFAAVRNSLRGLARITEETHRSFEQLKSRYCVLDFSDLEHKALEILRHPDGQKTVRSRYVHLFVDECQDISSIQDTLIGMLAGPDNTLFMVGDVKQSIYRFRRANPKLFRSKMEGGEQAGLTSYRLQENFRSRPEILETANRIFRDIMSRETAEVDYTPLDELKPGRTDCAGREPAAVHLLDVPDRKNRLEAIADHTAEQIRMLYENKTAKYRDIVILMPEVRTDGPILTELLRDRGIPVFFDGKGDFFQRPEIEILRKQLILTADPHQDLALIAVLLNPPFCFTEEEMSRIRIGGGAGNPPFRDAFRTARERQDELGQKCREAWETLEKWRYRAARMNLNDFLWYLAEDSGLYALSGVSDQGEAARKNIRNLCLQADSARKRGICTLREFLALLSDQESSGEMQAASALGEADDVVRIMTIHKSKGLQFPVVFCLGLDREFGSRPGSAVRLDEELGICLPYKDSSRRVSRRTAADSVFDWKKDRDGKAEKICLLYVAVTRAKERLYLIGTEQDRPLWHMPAGEYRVLAASDYLDWILPPLLDDGKKSTNSTQAEKPWEIRLLDSNQQKTVETGKVIHSLRPWVESLLSAEPVDELWKDDSEEAAVRDEEKKIRKYSVTTLLQNARNRLFTEETEQTAEEKRMQDYIRRALIRYQADCRPRLVTRKEEAGGALRGTAVHRFLSLVDLDAVRETGEAVPERLEAILDSLTRQKVFTPEEASWIRMEKVCRFYSSPVGRRMLASPEVHREWEFNLYLRDRAMILQGMIDCAFREEGGWILLDYKTDRIADEAAFTEEYRPQLAW